MKKPVFTGFFTCVYFLKWDKNEVSGCVEKIGNNSKTHKNTIYIIKKTNILYIVVVSYICTQFGIYCIVFKNINMYACSGLLQKI